MEQEVEATTRALIGQLNELLALNEDAETAIAVYKMANWIISQMDGMKQAAQRLTEQDMVQRGLDSLHTPIGSAGWTEPRALQLDEQAWREALARDNYLMKVQREFDIARAALGRAQEPYMALPESRFFIR